jgi:hypothetical protein
VWIDVSAMFSFARTSLATTPLFGVPTSGRIRSTGGAAAALPRPVTRGRNPYDVSKSLAPFVEGVAVVRSLT